MSSFHDRKAERTKSFHQTAGLKLVVCCACNGTGYYDNNGSPKCGCCDGTGKIRDIRHQTLEQVCNQYSDAMVLDEIAALKVLLKSSTALQRKKYSLLIEIRKKRKL